MSDVLENSRSILEILNLNGNKLGGVGLAKLCKGLFVNTKCEKLMLADNNLEQVIYFLLFDFVFLIYLTYFTYF